MLRPGQKVSIPCQVHGAPFPDQVLVRLEARGRWLDGVIDRRHLVERTGPTGRMAAEVLSANDHEVVLKVPKEISANFFSRSGRCVLDRKVADEVLRPLLEPT
jgi:hypothetical protein